MKRLPFQIFFSCIVFPPVLYVLTLQGLERVIQQQWTTELQGTMISDTRSLLQGRTSIFEEIKRNIENYLATSDPIKWGVVPKITVKTKTGRRIYPYYGETAIYMFDSGAFQDPSPNEEPEYLQTAQHNISIMDEGLELFIDAEIPRNTVLANSILGFYVIGFALVLYFAYHLSTKHIQEINLKKQIELEAARARLEKTQEKLKQIANREREQREEIGRLQTELGEASDRVKTTEDEALKEMEALENNLHKNIGIRKELEKEVNRLSADLESLEASQKERDTRAQRAVEKAAIKTLKRFNTLYKNINFQMRAVEGFETLASDMQLRAEELIQKMNNDPNQIKVKRKIFSGKSSVRVFECEFGYAGRMYWRRDKKAGNKAEIIAIGTKNTQVKDLAFVQDS